MSMRYNIFFPRTKWFCRTTDSERIYPWHLRCSRTNVNDGPCDYNKARLKQRSVVITLLDIKNAFGEVHHNLISNVLSYHHIPQTVQLLIANLYKVFTHPSFLIVSLLRLFPFSVECCGVIVLAPFCSTCALTHLYNSSSKKNILT